MSDNLKEISMETRLVANPNMVLREEGEEEGAILFDPDTGSVRILNLTAAAIYKLLDGRRTLSEVRKILQERFEKMDAVAEAQIMQLVRELHRIGVVGVVTELPK